MTISSIAILQDLIVDRLLGGLNSELWFVQINNIFKFYVPEFTINGYDDIIIYHK